MSGYKITIRGARPRFHLREFECPPCERRWEAFLLAGSESPCEGCGELGQVAISAPMIGTVYGYAATRGKSDDRPGPAAFDTSAIADGMKVSDWKAARKKLWNDRDRADWKAKTG